ncbi:helix-turn-helix domain-containing protein [Vibrio sp. D431a]|uniref:helix-turn-helix domain-containing protein n=1 Tax=Vibrio sp. D431a TaxID=2837388 RepID=UPI002554C06A|nr:helix-turn-helix domain-containing protein [Vibrio sp. D431a]MDK9790706.1 helix-turn-helix domain-containing protein [Vibrio sp. D431a]
MHNQKRSNNRGRVGKNTLSHGGGKANRTNGKKPSCEQKPRTQFDLLKPLHEALHDSDLTHTQRLILMTLHYWMDGEGRCYPSYKTIAKRASLHRSTVVRNMLIIIDKGWLAYDKGDSATARPNTYFLNLEFLNLDDGKADNKVKIVDLKSILTFADARAALELDGSLFTYTMVKDDHNGYTVEFEQRGSVCYFRSQHEIDLLHKFESKESAFLVMLRGSFVQGERNKRTYNSED